MHTTECPSGRELLIRRQTIEAENLLSQMESSYRVSTGFRSGTYQRLLVSEFGKICAKSPDVAKEIVTGSLNTVTTDQIIAIESTAEGREGYFYDFSKQSGTLPLPGANCPLCKCDFSSSLGTKNPPTESEARQSP